eukprot:3402026-Pyramimonas_sp.AAC.1
MTPVAMWKKAMPCARSTGSRISKGIRGEGSVRVPGRSQHDEDCQPDSMKVSVVSVARQEAQMVEARASLLITCVLIR